MEVFNLSAVLRLDTSAYQKGLANASTTASKFSGVAKAAIGAVTATIGAATTAATAFAANAVKVGMNFDASMSQVAATMGKTVDEIQDLREFAKEMGRTTSFSASQAADALNYMALAGYSAETSMKMLPNVLNLAAAGGIDLAYASDMITDSQSALGLSLEQTSKLVDQMAKAASKTNTSVAQLGEAILTVGGTAKIMKGGTVELSTALGILADNGIKGAEGGTALRNILMSMSSDKFKSVFGELGVSAYDANGKMRDMNDILSEMNQVMSSMTDEKKTKIISKAFNKYDLKAVNALLGTTSQRWNEVSDAIENSAGSSAKMAETQLDNLSGNLTKFKSALEGAQIEISDKLSPTLSEFVKFGTEGLSKITDAFSKNGFEGAIEAFNGVLGDALKTISKMLPDFIKAGTKIAEGIFKGIIDAIPTLIDAVPDILPTVIDGIFNLVQALIDQLPDIIPKLTEAVMKIIDMLTEPEVLTRIVEIALDLTIALIDGIWKALPKIIEALPKIVENLIKALLQSIPKIVDAGIKLFTALVQDAPAIIKGIVKAIPQIIAAIFQQFASFGTDLGKKFYEAWENIKKIFTPANVARFFVQVWDGIKSAFSSVGEWFSKCFGDAWAAIKNIFAPVGEMFGNIGKSILNALSSVINGIIWGINQVIKVPFEGLNGILRAIKGINIAGLKPFDWIGQIPVPQVPSIPMLSEGGVLKRGQVALLEGQGDEAVIPLSQNTEWIDKVADKLNKSSEPQNIYYTINIDVASMNANSQQDVENLADMLMSVMAEKTARKVAAW